MADGVPAATAGPLRGLAVWAAAAGVLAGLVLLAGYNYLLFHSAVEVGGIAVSFAIFLLVWNTRRTVSDSFFLLLGVAFLFVGILDLVHALAYSGMGVFPGETADLATRLWLAARYFQTVAFLAASLLIGRSLTRDRRYDAPLLVVACAAATALLLASIAAGVFPAAFVEGSGLTPFKVASEYVISLLMLATIGVLVSKRAYFDREVFLYLVAAQALVIAGELAFTSYASVYGFMNLLGHLLRLGSVYCFYSAIVVVGLSRPTDLLFRALAAREEALRRSERRYRSLVEYAPDAIFVDRDDRVDYLNPAGLRLFGAAVPEEVVGRPALDLFAPPYRDLVAARLRQLRSGSAVPLVDEQIVRSDGAVRDVEVAAFPFEDEAGPAIEVILRDVTDRKEAERRLRESEARLALALEVSGLGTFDADLVRGTVWRSPRFDRIFGTGADAPAWSMERFLDRVLLEDRERVGSAIAAAIASRTEAALECRIHRTDGAIRWVAVTGRGEYDEAGGLTRLLALVRDVTDQKEAEAALREYAARLKASNEDLERFAYVASHDLQEPLRSIVSFSQLLERRYRGKLDADADEYIAFIVEGGRRMQGLITDLLAFSRVATSAQPFERFETEPVLAEVLAELDGPIREAGAGVEHGPLPPVRGDRTQVRQVFANLIGNAIKYRRPDVPPEIRVSATSTDGMVEFAVRDNGIGIAPEYHDRIFEMFRRLHTHDEYEGTGIGLAVVKRIVERHGGTVRVESTPGEGSTFFFTLPAA